VNVNRARKEQLVKQLADVFEKYPNFYLIDFMKLPVSQSVELRKRMRENSHHFVVVKNRLALKAMREEFPEEIRTFFRGPTAIASTEGDAVGLARLIKEFSSQFRVLQVKAAMVEGDVYSGDKFEEIASLSSREDLIAKFGFLMAYPLMKLLRTMQSPLTSLGSVLSQLKTKK